MGSLPSRFLMRFRVVTLMGNGYARICLAMVHVIEKHNYVSPPGAKLLAR